MSAIQKLSQLVIHQIAAGEVIERPASIVRELLDNAQDAGATRISLELHYRDKKLHSIKVSDDGRGIAYEDRHLAFEKHATSKIVQFEDIFSVPSLGYRGEALASIAAVSRISLHSCAKASRAWRQIREENRTLVDEEEPRSVGTVVEVSDLFAGLPVREQFLKTAGAEKAEIRREWMRHVLSRRAIHWQWQVSGDKSESVDLDAKLAYREKVGLLMTKNLASSLEEVEYQLDEHYRVRGWVSNQNAYVKNRSQFYFFVRGRAIQDSSLNAAVSQACQGLLPSRHFPYVFLHIELPSGSVDINVHPQKKEMKFQERDKLFRLIYHGLRSALENSLSERPLFTPAEKTSDYDYSEAQPPSPYRTEARLADEAGQTESAQISLQYTGDVYFRERSPEPSVAGHSKQNPKDFPRETSESSELPNFRILSQLAKLYIVYVINDDLFIADQHALHERINYDRIKAKLTGESVEGQMLLKPLIIERSSADLDELEAYFEDYQKLGFELDRMSEKNLAVYQVPAFLPEKKEAVFIEELIDEQVAHPVKKHHERFERMISTLACRMSIMSGDRLSQEQMHRLIEKMYREKFVQTCPHGRSYIKRLDPQTIGKWFDR